jgi:hypothetical protein
MRNITFIEIFWRFKMKTVYKVAKNLNITSETIKKLIDENKVGYKIKDGVYYVSADEVRVNIEEPPMILKKGIDYKTESDSFGSPIETISDDFKNYLNTLPDIDIHSITAEMQSLGFCQNISKRGFCSLQIMGYSPMRSMFFAQYYSNYGLFLGEFDLHYVASQYRSINTIQNKLDIINIDEFLLKEKRCYLYSPKVRSELIRTIFKLSNLLNRYGKYGNYDQSILNMSFILQKNEMNYTYINEKFYYKFDATTAYAFVQLLQHFYNAAEFNEAENRDFYFYSQSLWKIGEAITKEFNIRHSMIFDGSQF